jgi:hypothetical protein
LIEPVEQGDVIFTIDSTGIHPDEAVQVLRLLADTIETMNLEVKE